MTLFEWMLCAHLVGDWILQTEWQAMHKRVRWDALLAHVGVYHLVLFVVVLPRVGAWDPRLYVAVLALAASHAWLDRGDHLSGLMRRLRIVVTRPAEGRLHLAVDQAIHVVLLGLAAAWLGR